MIESLAAGPAGTGRGALTGEDAAASAAKRRRQRFGPNRTSVAARTAGTTARRIGQPPGREGIARFVDLANVDSAVAIQTADRIRHVDGGIELLGRTPGAPPRGCSLALEHLVGDGC
jgi:hypothetical protein